MSSTYIPDSTIENIVDAILNARDFCGNEKEAAYDAASDNGLPKELWNKAYKIANFRANAAWNSFKKLAGVNPKYVF